jgi:3,4-dihydroxy 2-butanone 4-phosphate synthase
MDLIREFAKGRPVLVFDSSDREAEVDFMLAAGAVTPKLLAQMREDAGGLICVAIGEKPAKALKLPFAADLLRKNGQRGLGREKMPYGGQSAFSLTVNHRETFTGIPDADRALSITALAKLAARPSRAAFEKQFYAPGHVQLLIGRGLKQRQGHTELSLELCKRAGLPEAAVVCEMLDSKTGRALTPAKAKAYALRHGLAFAEGKQLI